MHQRLLFILLMTAAMAGACAHSMIEGTNVRDTDENRAIFNQIVKVRTALQTRDPNMLLGVVSTQYFEDCGTPDPTDDYGYHELKDKIMADALQNAKEVFVNFQVFDIQVRGDQGRADLRYNSRTRLDLPAGQLWDSHRDFDRLEFIREKGEWKIISGL